MHTLRFYARRSAEYAALASTDPKSSPSASSNLPVPIAASWLIPPPVTPYIPPPPTWIPPPVTPVVPPPPRGPPPIGGLGGVGVPRGQFGAPPAQVVPPRPYQPFTGNAFQLSADVQRMAPRTPTVHDMMSATASAANAMIDLMSDVATDTSVVSGAPAADADAVIDAGANAGADATTADATTAGAEDAVDSAVVAEPAASSADPATSSGGCTNPVVSILFDIYLYIYLRCMCVHGCDIQQGRHRPPLEEV